MTQVNLITRAFPPIIDRVIVLNQMVSERLIEMNNNPLSLPSGPFHIPYYINGDQRISEQEARFCYAQLLNEQFLNNQSDALTYSVETPTKVQQYNHQPNPKRSRSGQIDMSLYLKQNIKIQECNIEFKCGCGKSRQSAINNDIEKLVDEKKIGVFFSLIKAAETSTLEKLYENVTEAIPYAMSMLSPKNGLINTGYDYHLIFTFCILKWNLGQPDFWAVTKPFNLINNNSKSKVNNFFKWMIDPDPFTAAINDKWSYYTP